MGPLQRSDPPHGRVFSPEEIKTIREALQKLLALLEEYAPIWYTESERNQAQTAMEILSDDSNTK